MIHRGLDPRIFLVFNAWNRWNVRSSIFECLLDVGLKLSHVIDEVFPKTSPVMIAAIYFKQILIRRITGLNIGNFFQSFFVYCSLYAILWNADDLASAAYQNKFPCAIDVAVFFTGYMFHSLKFVSDACHRHIFIFFLLVNIIVTYSCSHFDYTHNSYTKMSGHFFIKRQKSK